jgi:hypothetical protein
MNDCCCVYRPSLQWKISSDMGTFLFRLLIITSQEDLLWHGYIHVSFTDHYFTGRSPLTWVHSCFVYWSLLHRKISSDMITFLFRLLIITSMEDLLWHGYFVASFTDHSFAGRSLLVLVIPFFAYWSLLHWKNSSDLGTLLLRIGNCFRGQSVLWRFFVSLKGKETQHKMCAYFKQ